MAAPRHIAFPFRFGDGGQIVTVEQHTDADVAGCIAAILSYPQGSRPTMPDFGMPPDEFRANGVGLEAIRNTLAVYEPRANATVLPDDDLAALVENITVSFQNESD